MTSAIGGSGPGPVHGTPGGFEETAEPAASGGAPAGGPSLAGGGSGAGTVLSALDVRARIGAGGPKPAAETRAVGPGGIYESTVFPPKGGVQREVIRFTTPRSPGGLKLAAGRAVEVPRALAGDGVLGVKVVSSGGGAAPAATVGGQPIPGFAGAPQAGRQPLHGPLSLSAGAAATVESIEVFHKVPGPADTVDFFPVNRTMRAGETFEIDLSSHRGGKGLDQIECIWTASYGVPDPSGRKSDEGKPFYLDGVSADVFLVDRDGNERQVGGTKFVDALEVDNLHDLPGLEGAKLRVKFFARNPEGKDHPITFEGVRLRYEDEGAPATPPATFEVGKTFQPGERCEVELPPELRKKKIARVDVRWTDMLSGTWLRPGYAQGTLLVDGKRVGRSESVQSPETQSFGDLGGLKAATGKVGVAIDADRAEVDWIKVYFED